MGQMEHAVVMVVEEEGVEEGVEEEVVVKVKGMIRILMVKRRSRA